MSRVGASGRRDLQVQAEQPLEAAQRARVDRPEGQRIRRTVGDVGQRLLDRRDVSLIRVGDAARGCDGDGSETKVRIRDDRAKPFGDEVHELGVGFARRTP